MQSKCSYCDFSPIPLSHTSIRAKWLMLCPLLGALPTVGDPTHPWPTHWSLVSRRERTSWVFPLGLAPNQDWFFSLASLCFDYFCTRKKFQDTDGLDKGCQQLYSLLNAMSPKYLVTTHIAFVPLAESGTFPQGLIPLLCGMQMNDACSWICAAKFSSQLQQLLEGREHWLLIITILGH